MSPGERIRKLREEHQVSQKELSRDLGYKTYTTVSKWESGASLPPGRELSKLATYFNVSTDYILGLDKTNHSEVFSNTVELDFIKPKTPDYGQNDIIKDKIQVPRYILDKEAKNYFVAYIQTEAMNRMIPSGNNVIVLDFTKIKKPPLKTGDVLIIRMANKFKVRHFRKTTSKIFLDPVSYDEEYDSENLTLKEFEKLEIIGKVIYTFRTF